MVVPAVRAVPAKSRISYLLEALVVLAVPAVLRRVRPLVARVVPAVWVVLDSPLSRPVWLARPAVRVVLVAPAVKVLGELRVTAAQLVPVVPVAQVPTVTLAPSLALSAAPAVTPVRLAPLG